MIQSIIVAIGRSQQIGLHNKLPWQIKEDLELFKRHTMGHHILMGRNTFESIGRALPGRTSLVVTSRFLPPMDNVIALSSINEATAFAEERGESELFIIGGAQIYQGMLPVVDRIYLSCMKYDGEADAFFPKINKESFHLIRNETFSDFEFQLLERKRT